MNGYPDWLPGVFAEYELPGTPAVLAVGPLVAPGAVAGPPAKAGWSTLSFLLFFHHAKFGHPKPLLHPASITAVTTIARTRAVIFFIWGSSL